MTTDTDEHKQAPKSRKQHTEENYSGHNHSSKSTPFNCEPTAIIGVFYHSNSTPQTTSLLTDGIKYGLSALTNSDTNISNQTYVSDIGLDETNSLISQVDRNNTILMNKTWDSTIAIEKEES